MADAARRIDTIAVARAPAAALPLILEERFVCVPAPAMLASLLAEQLAGRVAVVSSFGAESAVLLHMVAGIDPAIPVLFTDTGRMFAETLAYRDALVDRLDLQNVRTVTPDRVRVDARDAAGERWSYDPDGCCDLRKVEPLARALAPFDAWITGRKGFQATTRAALPRFEVESGRLKINPLADWTRADLDGYFARHDLPRHPLEEQGYPSIGCAPCTTRVRPGEDARAGRWRGFDKVECGIHRPIRPAGTEPNGT